MKKDLYNELKAKGLCISCRQPNDRETVRCSKCSEMAALYGRRHYLTYSALGYCVRCGRQAVPNRLKCAECIEKENARQAAIRDNRRKRKAEDEK